MNTTSRGQVLYLGPFRLPDRNAAAQRVIANAKALRRQGFDVVLAETGGEGAGGDIQRLPDHAGFICYRLPMNGRGPLDHPLVAVRQVEEVLDFLDSPVAVIAYNYPSIGLLRIIATCRRRRLRCAADVTEWYGTSHIASPVGRLMKWADTTLRMRVLHKRIDVLIVISSFLQNYYARSSKAYVAKVPPLVDATDAKWSLAENGSKPDVTRVVFAGSASSEKERLDATVAAVMEAAQVIPIHLDVVGVTAEEFAGLYPDAPAPAPAQVTFHGRVNHGEALRFVAGADHTIIARDRSRVTEAGFPTKFVESVTLGTPVLVTPHPDLSAIVADGRSGEEVTVDGLAPALVSARTAARQVDRRMFELTSYDDVFGELADRLGPPR